MENTNYQDDEIDLRDLINHLIKSKIIIIITTFVFVLMTVSYNYLAPKQEPIYQTTVKLIIGNWKQKNIQDLDQLIDKVNFYFPEPGLTIRQSGQKFLEIKLLGPSIEKNTYTLTEMANFVISDSEDILVIKKRDLNREISDVSKEIENFTISLDNIPSNHDLNINNELTRYYIKTAARLNALIQTKELLLRTHKDLHLFLSSSIFGDILSVIVRQTQDRLKINILFSAIAGLLLSIVALTFRYVFLKK